MFDLGWAEMAIILLVALIVIGPKDLPKVARNVGRWAGKARAMAREFQRSLEDMAREAELDEIKKEIDKAGRMDIGKSIKDTVDPEGDLDRAFDVEGKSKAKARATKAAEAGDGEAEPAAEPPAEPRAAEAKGDGERRAAEPARQG